MPWYNEEAEVEYDLDKAKEILETAGWAEGDDGIREKDGVRAEFTMLYPASDSVRQALAEDSKNQLAELGIEVTTEALTGILPTQEQSLSHLYGDGAHIHQWSCTTSIIQ